MLKEKILNKKSGLIFYGLTPPKSNTEEEKIQKIANKQVERLQGIDIDALILYDIQDETSRNDAPRPFPFMSTLSPDIYAKKYLKHLDVPKIIYNSVGKYTDTEFKNWINEKSANDFFSVFVGSPSKEQVNSLSLSNAYQIKKELNSSIILGGVTIPERHESKGDEHRRVFSKINKGCSFFVSQCVYSVNHSKNFLSDYYYSSQEEGRELVPIVFTLTPCGSLKTLQFMEWLGIDIPKWLYNELKHSKDILSQSVEISKNIASELIEFSRSKNIPIGFNIESVSIRKAEIDASIELLKDVKSMMK